MRISVNLATRPFIELRPLFAKLRLVAVGLVLLAVVLAFALRYLNAKARVAEAQMNALKATTVQYQQERQRNEARMRQPQNMAVLERSQFLNALFASKSFSWTSVMMDLERVLPAGVQVTSIEPTTAKSGDVTIRLRVTGDRDRTVELVRNLEHSQRFVSPRLAGEQTQAQDTNGHMGTQSTGPAGVEFDILSGYNPLPPEKLKSSKADKATDAGDSAAASAEPGVSPKTVSRRSHGKQPASSKQNPQAGGVR